MDKGQIVRDYRVAKNHKKQIPILAELNACDKQIITEILNEAGYKQMFNTNGVDISVKQAEIEKRYAAGENISVLAAVYHISKKQIKSLLGVEDAEEDKKMDNAPKGGIDVERLEKENREMKDYIEELKCQVKELTAKNDELQAEIMVLEDAQRHDDGLHEKYQAMCKLTSKVDGIDLFLAEYCAYCPDFTAEVNKTDITVMADEYEKNQVTIRCRNESKCARLYEKARREAGCNNDGTR